MRKFFGGILVLIVLGGCVPTTQFRSEETKRSTLQHERDGLLAENEMLTVENTEMRARIETVEAQKERFIEDSIRLYRKMDETQQELSDLERKYADLKSNYDNIVRGNARETRRLLNELQSTQEELATKESLLRDLQDNLTDQRQQVTRLNAELEARNARLREMERMLFSKDSIMNALKNRITDALLGFEGEGLTVTHKNGKVYVSLEEKLLFSSGSTVVDQKGQQALRQLSQVLARNPDINIMIEGHTDDVPIRRGSTMKDNWDLSVLRATSIVRIILDAAPVDPTRITVAGRGEYLPVDSADSDEARRKNRRTEIILSPDLDELYRILELN
jgi:chemotaxis protein MotB